MLAAIILFAMRHCASPLASARFDLAVEQNWTAADIW
jgi:hypothetical protein